MRVHDFSNPRWGHNISYVSQSDKDDQMYVKMFSWDSFRVEVWDHFVWGKGATIVAEVIETEHMANVWDMQLSTVRILTVTGEDGTVIYSAPPVKTSTYAKVKAKFKR